MKQIISLLLFILMVSGCERKSSEKEIRAFEISDYSGVISNLQHLIYVYMPIGTDVSALTPKVYVSAGADYQPKGVMDFTNAVTYTVTAEDGTTVAYKAEILLADNRIISFTFKELGIDYPGIIEGNNIYFTVPADTDITKLTPEIELPEKAWVYPDNGKTMDFTKPVEFTVSLHGIKSIYTVHVTKL